MARLFQTLVLIAVVREELEQEEHLISTSQVALNMDYVFSYLVRAKLVSLEGLQEIFTLRLVFEQISSLSVMVMT
jgi:hypothetical protein